MWNDCTGLHLVGALIDRAETVLNKLDDEGDEVREALVSQRDRSKPGPQQRELFAAAPEPLAEELNKIDIDDLTPRQAVDWIRNQQASLKER